MTIDGPLPIVDAGSILQRQSIKALQNLLPEHEYLFRDERIDDYGVDGSLELLDQGRATNIRAQVQLKGRSATKPNGHGAIPVRVETANLNYLLNGLYPLYVLFRPVEGELWVLEAREEWALLARTNPDWKTQETVTIYFTQRLTAQGLVGLRQRIADEGKTRRSVSERLDRLRHGLGTVVIDARSLAVTDSTEAVEILSRMGQSLTNAGLATAVVERGRSIPTKQLLAAPRAALAVAHAHFHLAQYYDAAAALRQLLLSKPELDGNDGSLLDALFISTQRLLGQLDQGGYERAMDAWSQTAPAGLAAQYTVSQAWADHRKAIAERRPAIERAHALADLRTAFERGKTVGGDQAAYIELLELTLEELEMEEALLQSLAIEDMASRGSGDLHHARIVRRASQKQALDWFSKLTTLEEKTSARLPRINCEVWLLQNHAVLAQAIQTQLMARTGHAEDMDDASIVKVFASVERTLQLAKSLENRELELNATRNLVRALDIFGRAEEATALATDALRIADLSGCADQALDFSDFLRGEGRFSSRLHQLQAMDSISQETLLGDAGHDDLLFMATSMAAAHQLPDSRIPNILHSLSSRKQVELERRSWCRHMVLAEHPGHLDSVVTRYAAPPLLKVVCQELGYETAATKGAVDELMVDLRSRFCAGCARREQALGPTPNKQARRNREKAERRKRRQAPARR